jgi:hypothetical protein
MKEDGASAALDARPLIVAGLYDYIMGSSERLSSSWAVA